MLTFDPVLVEKVALLLNQIIEDNPILSQFYTTGIFFFILMYTGSNVLPIARFLKYSHMKQAFRSDIEVSTAFFSIYPYVVRNAVLLHTLLCTLCTRVEFIQSICTI